MKQTNNIITIAQINGCYSRLVASKLESGMMIHPSTMRGTQGELAYVDLTDEKDVYRVSLNRECVYLDDEEYISCDSIVIRVEKHKDAYNPNSFDAPTLWNGKGETIVECPFYSITTRFYLGDEKAKFTVNLQFALNCYKVRRDRYKNKYVSEKPITLTTTTRTLARDIARNHSGYKRVKRVDIEAVERLTYKGKRQYRIGFNNGKSALFIGA